MVIGSRLVPVFARTFRRAGAYGWHTERGTGANLLALLRRSAPVWQRFPAKPLGGGRA